MTKKTGKSSKKQMYIAAGGGTVLCAALAVLIAARLAPDDKQLAANTSAAESKPAVSVEISPAEPEYKKPTETKKPPESTDTGPDNTAPDTAVTEIDPDQESKNFIDNGGIEVKQNFPEPEKTNEPPAPPVIEDEEMLTNPDQEPTYEPEQVDSQQTAPEKTSDTPKHGDKKNGMVYINGFGWVADEGGGGVCEPAPSMRENGNKVGYFG